MTQHVTLMADGTPAHQATVAKQTVFGLASVEADIYQLDNAYFPDRSMRMNQQPPILQAAFEYHYERNETYRRYCELRGVTPALASSDPRLIPLIPSTVFKQRTMRSQSDEATVLRCLSSGTQGSVSVVERDNTTLERFLGTIRSAVESVYGIDDCLVLNLGPPSSEMPDLWFSYVMNVTDLLFETRHYVHDNQLDVAGVLRDLADTVDRFQDILLIGAPIMFLEFFAALRREHRDPGELGRKTFIVTAGGWKRHEHAALSRSDFRAECARMLPGLDLRRIRDVYNMVELNTIVPECTAHHKHVPLWLDTYVIDLETYGIAPDGKVGLLAFLDASARSYPGFVLSGDLGRVSQVDDCPCGRPGVCIEVVRRVNTIEARGCALRVAKSRREG